MRGWSGLALLWLAAIALALGVAVEMGALERLFLGALAGLTVWTSLSLLWTNSVPETVLELELHVADGAVLRRVAEPLVEAECGAQPVGGRRNVLVEDLRRRARADVRRARERRIQRFEERPAVLLVLLPAVLAV